MFFYVVSEKTSAKNSIFNSGKKRQIINTSHNKLTQSVRLNKDIIYNDTLNKSAINFYYISNPKPDYTLYIKCPGETISQKYVQIFDSTYKELDYKLQKKSSYLCINLDSPLSDISDKTCIYISIGNTSTVNNKIYILYAKTEKSKNKSSTSKNNTTKSTTKKSDIKKNTTPKKTKSNKSSSVKHNSIKHNTSNKPKNGDKIKKTKTSKDTRKTTNNIKPQTTANNFKKDTANSDSKKNIANSNKHKTKNTNKTTRTKPVKINKRKNKKLKIHTKKHTAKNNTKKVTPKLQKISLSQHYILLKKGNSLHLNFTTQPANLHGCKYIWTTSNPKVASVSLGKITAKSSGLAVIKLKIIHNQVIKTSTCTVRITI